MKKTNMKKYQHLSSERDRPMCAIKWTRCKDCPDFIDHQCKWVTAEKMNNV